MTFNARKIAGIIAPFMGPDFAFKMTIVLKEAYLAGRLEQAEIDGKIAGDYWHECNRGDERCSCGDEVARIIAVTILKGTKKIGSEEKE